MNLIFFILFAVCCATSFAGCVPRVTVPEEALESADSKEEIILAPTSAYETCRQFASGKEAAFSYQASGPVLFEVHAHNRMTEPLIVHEEDAFSGILSIEDDGTYCGKWENIQSMPVSLEYVFDEK